MDKGIGFNRNIYLAWLDAAAAFCGETDDAGEVRARLDPVLAQKIRSAESRNKAINILLNIWIKSAEVAPTLREEAVTRFRTSTAVGDRIWLHYGLTLLAYPFFRDVTAAVGQLGRIAESVTPAAIKGRLIAGYGQLGSLEKAVERVMFSLRDWEALVPAEQRYTYALQRRAFGASDPNVEAWLLACALQAHPAEELPFADLLRLPELFPFRFTLTVDHLRAHPRFRVQRQGAGWYAVRGA
jgi:hypothetical protein